MTTNIFTYGSLMFPQVWERVVRRRYCFAPATAPGHARFAIKGETYPGMIAVPAGTVRGVLYFDVAADDVAALDAFEGEDYRRGSVRLQSDSGETLSADTYIYLRPERLSGRSWQPEAFQMQRFLESYCRDNLDK